MTRRQPLLGAGKLLVALASILATMLTGGTASALSPAGPSFASITRQGQTLLLDDQPYVFVGVNAYEIGTVWGVNSGCGPMVSDAQLGQLFSSLPPNSLVRFWALQGTIGTNVTTRTTDFGPLDRVFAAAARYHQRLIPVLGGQGSMCDNGHWQDPSWYAGGYRDVFNGPSVTDGNGLTPLSYWDWLRAVVTRYRRSPALGMWEPMSEPDASTCAPAFQPDDCAGHQTCPDEHAAAVSLRSFYDTVGREIHSLDPAHLVEAGITGSTQCGLQGADYRYVGASPGIDVLSYHDYYGASPDAQGIPPNSLADRLRSAAELDKPIIGGEVGVPADFAGADGCPTPAQRTAAVEAKLFEQLAAGVSGDLIWDWVPAAAAAVTTCSFDITPSDPLMESLSSDTPHRLLVAFYTGLSARSQARLVRRASALVRHFMR